MSEATPGPWAIQELADNWHGYDGWKTFCVRSPRNVHLATVGDVDRFHQDDHEANARLIAAAPDLLFVARLVAEGYNDWPESHGSLPSDDTIRLLRAAIAKAEGQA